MIAALFVEEDGVYSNLPNVDPWPESRDARLYAGPHAVVAHPPCQRFGRYWSGGPSAKVKRKLGDDDGCFESALASVRKWGGVLEHPEASHAWRLFGLIAPPRTGGWVVADDVGGWTCCVEQGHYGHPARKATWLYACGWLHPHRWGDAVAAPWLPSLPWGKSSGRRLDEGFHSREERAAARAAGIPPRKRLSTKENLATPIPFRDLLISIAESAQQKRAA